MRFNIIMISMVLVLFSGCNLTKQAYEKTSTAIDNANIFTYQDDIDLGKQVAAEIAADPKQFPILPESSNREIYSYMRSLRDVILNTNQLKYKDKFDWDIKIINDNNTLNAFATPGGHIYIYTGLIKYLDNEDELLGVLGHEMAHADQRHSTRQLTKSYGLSVLLSAAIGDKESLEQIVGALLSLKFSRSNEAEADEYSVKYLCGTPYDAAGAAGFFKKMMDSPTTPEFLSTHPSPKNRVKDIEDLKTKSNCSGSRINADKYLQMKKLLK
ncbi:MAG: M48 family metallopeptidase [Saprospiraceae bacterium]